MISYENKKLELIKKLKMEGRIKTKEVERAFIEIPRENFIPETLKNLAYIDTPLEIGDGQTISAPHMVAIMCELLDIKKGQIILEVGAGSGYHAAIVSRLVGNKGHVYTVERFDSLAVTAKKNLENIGIKNVTVEIGDGSKGLLKNSPYKRIYVTCAAPKIPNPLIEQLSDPGKMLIPVGRVICRLELIEKKKGNIQSNDFGGCTFVPLIGKYGF
jgi:protein-L-isoaspartate(D-aspartate) O-methyltransferase